MEGVELGDVTGQFYSSDPQIGRKRAMMRAWVDLVRPVGGASNRR
jgi:hypothetical protein